MTSAAKDFDNDFPITWCPGCGNFAILSCLKQALAELDYKPHQVVIVSGIGQAGKTPHYLRCNFLNGLHGRAIPVASAVRMANSDIPVIAIGGDGDMYGEGGNHFLHAIRRNVNITVMVHNNKVFGLTQGQASPTTDLGIVTKVQTHGVLSTPMNPLAVAAVLEAAFVARGYAGNQPQLVDLIKKAIRTDGFSLLDILQPCVSFDRVHTYQWYKDRVYDLGENGHDETDLNAAVNKTGEWGDKVPVGVFYRNPKRTSFEKNTESLKQGPLVKRKYNREKIEKIIDTFL